MAPKGVVGHRLRTTIIEADTTKTRLERHNSEASKREDGSVPV